MKSALALLLVVVALAVQPAGVYGAQRPAGCSKRVPLYPGYPGYRGNVPGLNGVGDYVCLETLQQRDPSFSRSREDVQNRAAAQRLGITGEFSDWTWEIWMQIEAERGLRPSCYSCLATAQYLSPTDPTIKPIPNDARVLAGSFASPVTITYLATKWNQPQLQNFLHRDYTLRAIGFIVLNAQNGHNPTAPELLDFYDFFVQESNKPGGTTYDAGKMVRFAIDIGGYAPTSPNAPVPDQIFMMTVAVSSYTVYGWDPGNVVANTYLEQLKGWQAAIATGPYMSFAQYLRTHWFIYTG